MHKATSQNTTPLGTRETERLSALISSGILDTPPETDFDEITAKLKGLFNVPVALMSLIDKDRQWFKSACGIDVQQTPRDIAFCTYTILSEEVMVVLDATRDDRFKNNPLVTNAPHIRFYAGAPIIVPDGLMLGTLCIIDTQPRDEFSAKEKSILAELAHQASMLIQEKANTTSAFS